MTRRLRFLALGLLLGLVRVRAESQDVNLETVLRLAGAQNLSLEMARERVLEARRRLEQDRGQLFPWIAPGIGYRRHDGNLQDIVGNVFDASKQSGTAALTVQAQLDLGDSIYRVLASKQAVRASEAAQEAGRRDTLAAAATAYLELSRSAASVVAAADSLRIADGFLGQVRQAVEAGLAFAGDVQRAEVQRERTETLRLKAVEDERVASVRLAQLLRLPPLVALRPDLGEFVPVALVATNRSLESLVAAALGRRPELQRAEAQVAGARAGRDGATRGPWLPTVGAQAALGGMAGGRNGDFHNGDDFQDYGLSATWRIGPGGIGDRSRVRAADSRLRLARLEQEQQRDQVVREVLETHARLRSAAEQVAVAGRAVVAATRLLELTRTRREFGVGAVLEAIDAERELDRARLDQLRAISDHNRLHWELWRAVGEGERHAANAER